MPQIKKLQKIKVVQHPNFFKAIPKRIVHFRPKRSAYFIPKLEKYIFWAGSKVSSDMTSHLGGLRPKAKDIPVWSVLI